MPSPGILEALGYDARWENLFAPYAGAERSPARVVRTDRGSGLVATATTVVRAKPAVHLLKSARSPAELPAVGDWVVLRSPPKADVAFVDAVLKRRSAIARGAAGPEPATQVLAANIDVVFVVHPIDGSPNLRRIERELALAWESGAMPIVVLTKCDLAADPAAAAADVAAIAPGTDVLVTSAITGQGLDALPQRLAGPRTAVLLGPSGAGKSALVNALLGAPHQATRDVRVQDRRGRHTTVARQLFAIPGGGVLIDTPGLRALGLTGSEDGIASAFADLDAIATACRFRDCTHADEPGCAVRAAVASGVLAAERLASYHKLQREARAAAVRSDARLRAEDVRKWKMLHQSLQDFYKRTGRR